MRDEALARLLDDDALDGEGLSRILQTPWPASPGSVAVLEATSRRFPNHAGLWRHLGAMLGLLMRYEAAVMAFRHLVRLTPDDPAAYKLLADVERCSYTYFGDAPRSYGEALRRCGPDDAGLAVAVLRRYAQEDWAEQLRPHIETLPGLAVGVPSAWILWVQAHRSEPTIGEQVSRLIRREYGSWSQLRGEEYAMLLVARLRMVIGDTRGASAAIAPMRASLDHAVYEQPAYFQGARGRLERLREVIGGRDVAVLLQGPSLTELEARREELRDQDVAFATINSLRPVMSRILEPIGRDLSVLFSANPACIAPFYESLASWLVGSSPTMLVTQWFALTRLPEIGITPADFLQRFDQSLLGIDGTALPSPSHPLHFLSGNSLAVLLPILVIGRARRIFLFGADGGAHPDSEDCYFYDRDVEESELEATEWARHPRRIREGHRRLARESAELDELWSIHALLLSEVFGESIPEVLNCCPHSTIKGFPRVDLDTGLAALRS